MNAYENHDDYQFGGMNDPIEFLGYVLHELEDTAQCCLCPFLWHVTMARDWITVQCCNKCKKDLSCYSSSGGYPLYSWSHHTKMDWMYPL